MNMMPLSDTMSFIFQLLAGIALIRLAHSFYVCKDGKLRIYCIWLNAIIGFRFLQVAVLIPIQYYHIYSIEVGWYRTLITIPTCIITIFADRYVRSFKNKNINSNEIPTGTH